MRHFFLSHLFPDLAAFPLPYAYFFVPSPYHVMNPRSSQLFVFALSFIHTIGTSVNY
jgi:hypothetical protein